MGPGCLIDGANNGSSSGSGLHHILFRSIDGLSLPRIGNHTNSAGKYALAVQDCTSIVGGVQNFNTSSDGLHFTGPITNAFIEGVTGSTGDDMLAFTPQDWAAYDVTNGTIQNVKVGFVKGTTNAHLMVMNGSKVAGQKIRDIEIGPISGTAGASDGGIYLTNFNQSPFGGPMDLDNVRIGVINMTLTTATNVVIMCGSAVKGITFEGIHMPYTGTESGALRVLSDGSGTPNIDHIRIRRITASATAPANCNLVNVSSGATVNQLTIDDLDIVLADTNSRAVLVVGTVSDLNIGKVRAQGSSAGVGTVVGTLTPGVLTRANIGSANLTNMRRLFLNYAGATATHIQADHVMALTCNRLVENLSSSGTVTYNQSGGKFDTFGSPPFHANGGALAVAIGGAFTKAGATANLSRAAAEAIRYTCANSDAGVDVSLLTPSDGDMAFNTNGALGCGTGPVVYNSAAGKWKQLYTGLTT
jgi:hypothetical protein